MMNPKVSVAVISYRHERFIGEALQSIVDQQTDFSFEIVIGDDCSPDRTPEIIRQYADRYPQQIRVLPRPKNMGAIANAMDVEAHCRGEYIAWLEGDDYWTDRAKLHKQASYLDAHTECEICFGNAREIYEDRSKPDELYRPKVAKNRYSIADLLEENFIPTCSIMHRHRLPLAYPDWFAKLPQADWSRAVLLACRGQIGYIPETVAVRRLHSEGLWGGQNHGRRLRNIIASYEAFLRTVGEAHAKQIQGLIENTYLRLAIDLEKYGHRAEARTIFSERFSAWWASRRVSKWALFKLIIKFSLPSRLRPADPASA